MIRESTCANSPQALMDVTPGSGAEFIRRGTTGGLAVASIVAGITAPQWLRLVRTGNTFTAYRSANGVSWMVVGADTIVMATSVYVGLAVSSHADGTLCAAEFNEVSAPAWRVSIQGMVLGGEFQVEAPAAQGQSCVLEASTNLSSWLPLNTNVAANGNGVELTDGIVKGRAQRFYRVRYPD